MVLRYTAQHATRVKYCLIASMLAHVVAALCGSALLSIYQVGSRLVGWQGQMQMLVNG